MKNQFKKKTFFNIRQNAQKSIYLCNYIVLYKKTALRFNFGLWEVPNLENVHFHFHAFFGWGTSRGPKLDPKVVFLKSTI